MPQAVKKLQACQAIGRAGIPDIGWPSWPIGTVSCTALVLSNRTGEPSGRQLAIVAYRRIGTVSYTAERKQKRRRKQWRRKQERRRDRGKSI